MKRFFWASALFLLPVCGCGNSASPEEESARIVLKKLGCHVQCIPARTQTLYSIEPMSGGYAVLVEPESTSDTPEVYAYWVREEIVYTVNEAAAECSPGLPVAPKEISYESLCKVIQDARH